MGTILIIFGVFIWIIYGLVRFQLEYTRPVTPFLGVRLLFVVLGASLAGRGWTQRVKEIFARGEPADEPRNS